MLAKRVLCGAVLLTGVLLVACGTPSVGVGYGIPGTPVSVGTSVPLGKSAPARAEVVYRPLRVDSTPAGAEIYLNDQLVGSTPQDVQVPFEKGTFGSAKGAAQLLLKKPGYLPEGVRLFPSAGARVSQQPNGTGIGTLTVKLRRG